MQPPTAAVKLRATKTQHCSICHHGTSVRQVRLMRTACQAQQHSLAITMAGSKGWLAPPWQSHDPYDEKTAAITWSRIAVAQGGSDVTRFPPSIHAICYRYTPVRPNRTIHLWHLGKRNLDAEPGRVRNSQATLEPRNDREPYRTASV